MHRHMVADQDVGDSGGDLRSVPGGRVHPCRELTGHLGPAAGAALDVGGVLGHHRVRYLRQVVHLPAAHPDHGLLGQRTPAGAPRRGRDADPLIRVVHQPQRGARITGLLTRPTARDLP